MKSKNFAAAASAAVLLFSGTALAQTMATATTDLNIRSGPGPQYSIVGVIDGEAQTTVNGCLEDSKWCAVNYDGTEGWAYSEYLTAEVSGEPVVIVEKRAEVGVPVATFDDSADGTLLTGAGGAIAGALVAGPVGALVGGFAGAAAGATADELNKEVRSYVVENPGEPVFLEGEVVVGAGIPETVELRPIPDVEEYRYVNVNGQLVLVEPADRQIVYVIR